MSIELKPCPFCGADAELEHANDHHGEWFNLGCSRHWDRVDPDDTCVGARLWYTEIVKSEDEAIEAWNTRTDATKDAEIARLREALEWKPINTAPKDGTTLLLAHEFAVFDGWWSSSENAWIDGETNIYGDHVTYQPTHWMRLPALPIPDPAGGMPVEVET